MTIKQGTLGKSKCHVVLEERLERSNRTTQASIMRMIHKFNRIMAVIDYVPDWTGKDRDADRQSIRKAVLTAYTATADAFPVELQSYVKNALMISYRTALKRKGANATNA